MQPGDKVFVKVFRRKWFNERRQGPFEVVRSTGTAVQVKGSPTWYHLSHCVKAPKEVASRSQRRDDDGPREPNAAEVQEDLQGQSSEGEIDHAVDIHDDFEHIADTARDDLSDNGQERRFSDIALQHVPETAEPMSLECDSPETPEGCDVSSGESRDPVRPRSPRPIRNRVRPKRYED